MTRSTYNRHRILAGVLFCVILFAAANYYLDLGFFGRGAKGFLILATAAIFVYGSFFSPTRQDMQEHSGARKDANN